MHNNIPIRILGKLGRMVYKRVNSETWVEFVSRIANSTQTASEMGEEIISAIEAGWVEPPPEVKEIVGRRSFADPYALARFAAWCAEEYC